MFPSPIVAFPSKQAFRNGRTLPFSPAFFRYRWHLFIVTVPVNIILILVLIILTFIIESYLSLSDLSKVPVHIVRLVNNNIWPVNKGYVGLHVNGGNCIK